MINKIFILREITSYLLFGTNILSSSEKLISRLSEDNSKSKMVFLHSIMSLWTSGKMSKNTHFNETELNKNLETAFKFFNEYKDYKRSSDIALKLLQHDQNGGQKLIFSCQKMLENKDAFFKKRSIELQFRKIMSILLKLDDRLIYKAIENILNRESMSNDSYINQVLHYEILDENWSSSNQCLIRLTKGLELSEAKEKIELLLSSICTRLMLENDHVKLNEIQRMLDELNLLNSKFSLQSAVLLLANEKNDIEFQKSFLKGIKITPDEAFDSISPLMNQLSRNQEDLKYLTLEQQLLNVGLSDISYAIQALAISLKVKQFSKFKSIFSRLLESEGFESYKSQISIAFKPFMTELYEKRLINDHCSYMSLLSDNKLLINDFVYQNINLVIDENDQSLLEKSLALLDRSEDDDEVIEKVNTSTRDFMRSLVVEKNKEKYREIQTILEKNNLNNSSYLNQEFYHLLSENDFSRAIKKLVLLPNEIKPLRETRLLDFFLKYVESESNIQEIENTKSQIIDYFFSSEPLTPVSSFNRCEAVFDLEIKPNINLLDELELYQSLEEMRQNDIKDPVILSFITLLINTLDSDSEIDTKNYIEYFSYENKNNEAAKAIIQCISSFPERVSQNAFFKIYQLAKSHNDTYLKIKVLKKIIYLADIDAYQELRNICFDTKVESDTLPLKSFCKIPSFKNKFLINDFSSNLLFGDNVLFDNEKLISVLSQRNGIVKSIYLHSVLALWVNSDNSIISNSIKNTLDENLLLAFELFFYCRNYLGASEVALKLLRTSQDDGEKLIISLVNLLANKNRFKMSRLLLRLPIQSIMSTLLELDSRKNYRTVEYLLEKESLTNDSYTNQVLHFDIADENWISFKHQVKKLIHGLTQELAKEKIEVFLTKQMSKLMVYKEYIKFTKVEEILDGLSLSNEKFKLQSYILALDLGNELEAKRYLRQYKGLTNIGIVSESILETIAPFMNQLARNKEAMGYIDFEQRLSNDGISEEAFAFQALSFSIKLKELDLAKSILLRLLSSNISEEYSEKVSSSFKPYMRDLFDDGNLKEHDSLSSFLSENGLLINDYIYQRINLVIEKNDLNELKASINKLITKDTLSEDLVLKVNAATRNHMRALSMAGNKARYRKIEALLRSFDLSNVGYINQCFYYFLEDANFAKARETLDLISDERNSLREIALLRRMFDFSKDENADSAKLSDIQLQLINSVFNIEPMTPGDSFRHCEIIFSTTLALNNNHYHENKFQQLCDKNINDPILKSFLNIVVNAFHISNEIPIKDYLLYFSNETDRREAIDTLFKALYSVQSTLTESAIIKLYNLVKSQDDTQRQLFLLHQVNANSSEINISDELKIIQPQLLEKSKFQLIKPHIKNEKKTTGNIKILLLTCIWRREELTKIVLKYYKNLAQKISDQIDLVTIVVGSEGKPEYMDSFGHEYVHAENKPLSNKWQKGIDKAKEIPHDAVVIVGSDDLISEKQFRLYCEALEDGHIFYGVADLGISNNSRSVYWPGYQPDFSARRYLESIGAARMIAKPLLKTLDYKLWDTRPINKGLDRLITDKLDDIGLPRTKKRFCPQFNFDGKTYYWGQVLYSYEETGAFVTDFKVGGGNITAFESFIKNGNCQLWVERDHLVDQYGMDVIDEIDELNQKLN